jgi:sugar diacid utilization regulator
MRPNKPESSPQAQPFDDGDFKKIIEGIQTLTSTLDLDELLKRIIGIALTVIPKGDSGIFRLYDPETQLLVPLAWVGMTEATFHFRTKVGESISGKMFEEGIPRIFNSKEEIDHAMSNLSPENAHYSNLIFGNSGAARTMMTVPVTLRGNHIGTMSIHRLTDEEVFNERELNILQGIADQMAIAIENARLYKEVQFGLQEVTVLSKQLEEKNQLLQKRIEVHETLMDLSINNKGIKAIIYKINLMIENPASFVDILDNKVYVGKSKLYKFSFEEISQFFLNGENSPITPHVHGQNYYLHPIAVGPVLLGCFIVSLRKPVSAMDIITIEQSCSLLALETLKKLSLTDVYYKKTHEYFNQLLQNHDRKSLLSKGSELGLDFSSFLCVAMFEITGNFELYQIEVNIQRLVLKINRELSTVNRLVYGLHNQVTLLITIPEVSAIHKISTVLETILKEWNFMGTYSLRAGVGRPYKQIENIAKSYNEAQRTLAFLSSKNQPGLMRYEEIGVNRLFLSQPASEIEQFVAEVFAPLISAADKTSQLEKTLLMYMAFNKSAVLTAKALDIHINTLYQRLKRIETLMDIHLENPEEMLKIQLAYHLKETFINA